MSTTEAREALINFVMAWASMHTLASTRYNVRAQLDELARTVERLRSAPAHELDYWTARALRAAASAVTLEQSVNLPFAKMRAANERTVIATVRGLYTGRSMRAVTAAVTAKLGGL
jgi:hypothetical protein